MPSCSCSRWRLRNRCSRASRNSCATPVAALPASKGSARMRALRIGLVAGEVSGDQLGAALIEALRARDPDVEFVGLAGHGMRAAGCQALGSSDELAVMGLVEPLRHLPRLLALRSRLQREFVSRRIDLFVGIDAPAFNLGLAR